MPRCTYTSLSSIVATWRRLVVPGEVAGQCSTRLKCFTKKSYCFRRRILLRVRSHHPLGFTRRTPRGSHACKLLHRPTLVVHLTLANTIDDCTLNNQPTLYTFSKRSDNHLYPTLTDNRLNPTLTERRQTPSHPLHTTCNNQQSNSADNPDPTLFCWHRDDCC